MSDDQVGGQIRRRTARSRVDYAKELTLHESPEMRIVLRSWFIRHDTAPTGLSVKLERYRRNERASRSARRTSS